MLYRIHARDKSNKSGVTIDLIEISWCYDALEILKIVVLHSAQALFMTGLEQQSIHTKCETAKLLCLKKV